MRSVGILLGLALAAAFFYLYGIRAAEADLRLQERPKRVSFYVVGGGRRDSPARDYVESLVRRSGIARLARSPQEADYILTPSMRVSSRMTSESHYRTIEVEYFNDRGEKKKRKERRYLHDDDKLTVITRFECLVERNDSLGDPIRVAYVRGHIDRSVGGSDAPGHDDGDPAIRIRAYQAERYEEELSDPEGNDGQAALNRLIHDLCMMIGQVMEIDREANRIWVNLGSEDGIKDKDQYGGVTEMELYAQTGSLKEYVFYHVETGERFKADRRSAEANPDEPEAWVYTQVDPLPSAQKKTIRGEQARLLKPLGIRVSDWAEVQEVSRDSCIVSLKRRGDFGRTSDDRGALQRLPDPAKTPIIARVRAKGK
jgi:hypothetical protein